MTETTPTYRADQDSGDEHHAPVYVNHTGPPFPTPQPPPVVNRFDGLRAAVAALHDGLERGGTPPGGIIPALSAILAQFPPSLIPAGVLGGEAEHHAIVAGLLADKAALQAEVTRLQAANARLLGALETALREQDTARAAQATRAIPASAADRFRRTARAWERFLPYDQQLAIVTGLIAEQEVPDAE